MRRSTLLAAACLLLFGQRTAAGEGVTFFPWANETFARARVEQRILVVTVSTTWCHWCHVMKGETYGDERVARALAMRFLPVDVDADARPDLAERFRDYHWPATAFLTSDGTPILALRGYRSPTQFLAILADVERQVARGGPYAGFSDPNHGEDAPMAADRDGLVALRRQLLRQLDRHYDEVAGGWGRPQKYPLAEPIEYGLLVAPQGGRALVAEQRALFTLDRMQALVDPIDGGMYQYSLEGRWDRWHPEKIMEVNAGALGVYADAYGRTGDARWRTAAQQIRRWLRETMQTTDGTYRASQDADAPGMKGEQYYRILDREGRRRHGVPRTDDRIYARENGIVIQALVRLHRATGDASALADARRAARSILATHAMPSGALRHAAEATSAPLLLLDQVAMGRALLALHQADLDETWLAAAVSIANDMEVRFGAGDGGGYFDATSDPAAGGTLAERRRSLEGNARAARLLLALASLQAESSWRDRALGAIRSVSRPDLIAKSWRRVGGLLLAVEQALAPYALVDLRAPLASAKADSLTARALERARREPWIFIRRSHSPTTVFTVCSAAFCSDRLLDETALDHALDRALGHIPK